MCGYAMALFTRVKLFGVFHSLIIRPVIRRCYAGGTADATGVALALMAPAHLPIEEYKVPAI